LYRGVSGHIKISQHAAQMCQNGTEDHLHQKCQI